MPAIEIAAMPKVAGMARSYDTDFHCSLFPLAEMAVSRKTSFVGLRDTPANPIYALKVDGNQGNIYSVISVCSVVK